jgi:branched-chain amino acid transport system ATP-binding protein
MTGLEIDHLSAGYARMTILREVTVTVPYGHTVALLGRNGAGKTTLVRAIMGIVRATSGRIHWQGHSIERFSTERITNLGIAVVPQDRGLFPEMTVLENLRLACFSLRLGRRGVAERLDEAFHRFPALTSKRNAIAASLSGGQQQMLAIGKALVRRPNLLLLDEPSTGLSPTAIQQLADVIHELHTSKLTLLVTEQNVHWLLPIADQIAIVEQGEVVRSLPGIALDPKAGEVVAAYIGEL